MNKENCVIANNDEWLQTPSPFEVIDEDMKIEVQMRLVDALQNKWRKLI